MFSSRFKHVICTRFGIGIQRAGFHERRLAIMEASLLPCIAAQTNANVHWLLVTDCRIPDQIRAALEALRGRVPNLHLQTIDPLSEYSLDGFKSELVQEIAGSDELVYLSRVDDDDAINKRYSEIMVSFLDGRLSAGATLPIAASWTQGLDVYVHENKGCLAKLPWLAPSIGVAMRTDKIFNLMGTHWTVGERAVASGGEAHEIDDQEPMWAWLRHKSSNSSEFRHVEREIRKLPGLDPRLTAAFPFRADEVDHAHTSWPLDPTPDLEVVDGTRAGASRLQFKYNMLQALSVIDRAIEDARIRDDQPALGSLTASRSTMVSVFYSL
jgi:hypothetical protein